jgi:hypothetical protein
MSALRYIRLPNPASHMVAGRMEAELNRAIAEEDARGIGSDTVYSARNRFRPPLQVASDPGAVAAVHSTLGDSEPAGLTWSKINRSVRAALQRAQQSLRRSSDS